MQALVLAGGQGTRLRPLTLDVPKPVVPLAGRPFLSYMLDWLEDHGVDHVVLSCGFLSDGVRGVLGSCHGDLRISYVEEEEPLGTAGPVRLAADTGLLEDHLLVLNGDLLTDIDLTAELERHERTGARATLALIAVEDTSSYGVVPTTSDGRVEAFLEKSPGPAPTNRVNAGCYVLEREVIDSIPSGRAVSFEREIFPSLVGDGLYGFPVEGYWKDIGTPTRYMEATRDLLSGRIASRLPERDFSGSLVPRCCVVDGAKIGPRSVLGSRCRVNPGAHVEGSVLHAGVTVGRRSTVRDSVLAAGVRVGDDAYVGAGSLVGSGATIRTGAIVDAGARIAPGAVVEPPARTARRAVA
ncbi:MAG: sugar phosphate nucleotidyltransferase [Gaiellaceae bacterium]